jgi:hypothetical protein
LRKLRERFVRARSGVDTPTTSPADRYGGANAWMCNSRTCGIQGNPNRMIETLKQAGMIVVLLLLAEGLFAFSRALGHGGGPGAKAAVIGEFLAGAVLCSSALILLYSLGIRDEK